MKILICSLIMVASASVSSSECSSVVKSKYVQDIVYESLVNNLTQEDYDSNRSIVFESSALPTICRHDSSGKYSAMTLMVDVEVSIGFENNSVEFLRTRCLLNLSKINDRQGHWKVDFLNCPELNIMDRVQ